MEITAEECRDSCETLALDFRVVWSFGLDPVEEGVDVELVVGDCRIDCVCHSSDFGEVADCETLSGRTADEVVGGVFVCVSGLLAACFDDFENCVYADALVGVNLLTFAVYDGLGKVVRIDAARKELGRVVV